MVSVVCFPWEGTDVGRYCVVHTLQAVVFDGEEQAFKAIMSGKASFETS